MIGYLNIFIMAVTNHSLSFDLQIILPVVWNASSTMPSSWSEAAMWNTEKTFFQPERIFAACEFTICAIHLTTMSRIVGDLLDEISSIVFENK